VEEEFGLEAMVRGTSAVYEAQLRSAGLLRDGTAAA